jgi:hypothetical protein
VNSKGEIQNKEKLRKIRTRAMKRESDNFLDVSQKETLKNSVLEHKTDVPAVCLKDDPEKKKESSNYVERELLPKRSRGFC